MAAEGYELDPRPDGACGTGKSKKRSAALYNEDMTSREKSIAAAAIKALRSKTYEDIYSQVAKATGIDGDEVMSVIERLAYELVLHKRGGPAHDVPGPDVTKPAEAWYEKGGAWKD